MNDIETYVRKRFIKKIQKTYSVKVIFVTECGSRAYGLDSPNSDYDLRFVYIQKDENVYKDHMVNQKLTTDLSEISKVYQETITGKYIVTEEKREVEVDWQGWDLTKAVKHLHEMNPSICEWIYSSVIYYNNEEYQFLENAQRLVASQKRISPLVKHYRAMGRKYYEAYVEGMDVVAIKKYSVFAKCGIMTIWLYKNQGSLLSHSKDFRIDIFGVLSEIKSSLPKKVSTKLNTILEGKKKNAKDWLYTPNRITKEYLFNVLFNTDEVYTKLKDLEDYKEESFRKYNKFLRKMLKIFFNET